MRIPIIVIVTMLSVMPGFILTQETPEPNEQTIPEQEEKTTSAEEFPAQEQTAPQEEAQQDSSPEEFPAEVMVDSMPESTEATTSSANDSQDIVEPTTIEIPTESSVAKALKDAPEPVKDEALVIPEEAPETEKPTGIDTVSLDNPQGNWLFKKIWWERAEERYEKIRILVDGVWESRTIFFVKRNELDRNVLDPFYLTVGIGQGELQTILSEMVDFFEKHREEQGDLNEQERMLYETIAPQEEALKQLMLDVESIANLDHSIDDALGTLMNQINRVRQFERDAWNNFKEIAHILNDTKARELYYMIEGAARNIKNISTYLERDFLNHFNTLVSEATKHVTRVQNQIDALKEQGINFKRQTELLEQQHDHAQQQDDSDSDDEDEDVAPKPKLGWFSWILSWPMSIVNGIFSIIQIPYNMIFGK